MNIALWIIQIILAIAFGMAGSMKVSRRKEDLAKRMGWVNDFSQGQVRLIGTLELLGVVGLILPQWTGILPIFTPIAATGLALIMIGAAITHLRRHEASHITVNIMLFILAAFVAYGRFGF
jgi:uncharacterized membrane protein YphA (DoxX/SURF4 family)